MADSEEDWIKKRAYALWEEEGYPAGKDREHWERAKLEYATLKPVASNAAPVIRRRKSAAEAAPAKAAPKTKAVSPKTATKAAAPRTAASKTAAPKTAAAPAKTASKTPAAIPASAEPAKKRSRKVPAGE
ncbi:DUF2934 domain-containing protein [Neorhizobium sp. CSC1952]|uniref:DUF2934 domain-containing protein n=1 Tax=Neorhizobium sp. CSC1952 TaxID=2978974 RepID=UPI0025A5DBCC|nr:DUF2934 domain-containing protein [Rhizobium sp. CSC1952]WJR65376.1 DUF2934 domain-containing protein [Rhizobium sp. CSC1952]